MSRLMSVAYTEDQVRDRTKFVTRRKGWWQDKNGKQLLVAGDHLMLCRKVMGRKPGEALVRIAHVEVADVRRETLDMLTAKALNGYGDVEMILEGFPGMNPGEFIDRYFVQAQSMQPSDYVTRIQWRYLTPHVPTFGRIWTDDASLPEGGTRFTVKRACNGCGRLLGDVLPRELDLAVAGHELPDVTAECGCPKGLAA